MQTFAATHLQQIRGVFAILAEGLDKNSCEPVEIEPESPVTARQLADFVNEQKNTALALQEVTIQLTQLTELAKQLKMDSEFSAVLSTQAKVVVSEVIEQTAVNAISETEFIPSLAAVESKVVRTCQSYFSALPWSSDIYVSAATKTRSTQTTTAVPHIMQLATATALASAAQAATVAKLPNNADDNAVPETEALFQNPQSQTCGTYFHALPWAAKAELQPNIETVVEAVVADESVAIFQDFTQEIALTVPSAACADYFQALPWTLTTPLQKVGDLKDEFESFFANESALPEKIISQEANINALSPICGSYFQALPWQVQSNTAELEKRRSALKAIFSRKPPPSDEDFLQILNQKPPVTTPHGSQSYFQTLPWGN